MQHPLQITLRDIPHTQYLEEKIRSKALKLEKFCDKIIYCSVVVDKPEKSKLQGKNFKVQIDIQVPKEQLVVSHLVNENLYLALDAAFDAARRQLLKHRDKMRGKIKMHHYIH